MKKVKVTQTLVSFVSGTKIVAGSTCNNNSIMSTVEHPTEENFWFPIKFNQFKVVK